MEMDVLFVVIISDKNFSGIDEKFKYVEKLKAEGKSVLIETEEDAKSMIKRARIMHLLVEEPEIIKEIIKGWIEIKTYKVRLSMCPIKVPV